MNSSEPTPRIVGYKLGRKVSQSEIPAAFELKARDVVGMLGSDNVQYSVAPGVDVLELGILHNAGHFVMIPYDAADEMLWDQTVDLLLTAEQAAVQRDIHVRLYEKLLALLPHDAADLQAGVASLQDRGQVHPVFDLLRRAAVNTWAAERQPAEPLTDAERDRLEAATARRAVDLLREGPRCRLDRDSLQGIVAAPSRCTWDRVLRSLAQRDYDDAIVRALGRIKIGRGLEMPISCVLQILPHIQRLDIFFLIARCADENPAPALQRWLERGPLGAVPATAELAVRVLYVIWRMTHDADEANAIVREHVRRIRSQPSSRDARLVKRFLATAAKLKGDYLIPKGDVPLFERIDDAVERWERALITTVDEIILSLPGRLSESNAGG